MKRYLLLTVAMVAMILATGCGGTGNLNAGPTNATINTTDGLNDAIVKFELSVSSLTPVSYTHLTLPTIYSV